MSRLPEIDAVVVDRLFWLFCWGDEPCGGFSDFRGEFKTIDEAKKAGSEYFEKLILDKAGFYASYEVFDFRTKHRVCYGVLNKGVADHYEA